MKFELKDDRFAVAARGGSLRESLTSNFICAPLRQAFNEQARLNFTSPSERVNSAIASGSPTNATRSP
jgi:hypothetical protein